MEGWHHIRSVDPKADERGYVDRVREYGPDERGENDPSNDLLADDHGRGGDSDDTKRDVRARSSGRSSRRRCRRVLQMGNRVLLARQAGSLILCGS